jgi:hypothetical protein
MSWRKHALASHFAIGKYTTLGHSFRKSPISDP